MILNRPEALLLLALLPLVWWWHRRAPLRDTASRAVVIGRLVFLGLVILALARPETDRETRSGVRVVAVDLSSSMGPLPAIQEIVDRVVAGAPPEEELHLVVFADHAREVASLPRAPRDFPRLERKGLNPDRSRLAGAVDLALALVPEGAGGGVTLITDGRENGGAVRDQVARLSARGVALDVVVGGVSAPAPVVTRARVPAQAPVGRPVSIRAEVEALADGGYELRVRGVRPESPEERVAVHVEGGRGEAWVPVEVRAEGVNTWELTLHDAGGRAVPGGLRRVATQGLPPRVVWLVESAEAPTQQAALAKLLGPGARVVRRPASTLTGETPFTEPDFVVLADVPISELAPAAVASLAEAVEHGLGLLVTGGDRSFGPGGYAGTRLEEILPVRFLQKEERRDPSATLVIIIDTSGSMSGSRIQLAKEVARLALRRLKPHDKAGIVEFHGAKRWAAPIQPAANAVEIQRALNRLNAGGGTVILPAIDEAYYALLNVRTRTRHVLVLTDGGVEQGAFEPLIRKMADRGMTLSTVLVGPGTHSAFLVSLAQWGRGRYYHAPDRFNMPEVIVKQPESSLLSPAVEEPVALRLAGRPDWLPSLPAIPADRRLRGRLEVEARPTADVLIETDRVEPVLCRWQHGLGQVSAWTSHLAGAWSEELTGWEGYARLLTGLFREGSRTARPDRVRLRAGCEHDRLVVFAWPEGNHRDGAATFRLTVETVETVEARPGDAGDGVRRTMDRGGRTVAPLPGAAGTDRTAPLGVVVEDVVPGLTALTVQSPDGRVRTRGALVVPEPTEWTRARPDRTLLDRLARTTGGRSDGTLSPVPAGTRARGVALWPVCVWLALAAFLAMIFLRRRSSGLVRTAVLAGLLAAAFGSVASTPAQPAETGAGETIPPAVAEQVDAARAAGLDSAEGRQALTEAARRMRLEHGGLERLIAYLEARSAAAPAMARLLACVASMDGRPERSLAILKALDEKKQLTGGGLAEYARVLENLGREDAALAVLERARSLVQDPALSVAVRIRLASLRLSRGGDQALEPLRSILAEHPGHPDLTFYLAYLAALHGRPELLREFTPRSEPPRTAFRDRLIQGTVALGLEDYPAAQRHFLGALDTATLARDRRYAQERLIAAHRAAGSLGALCDQWLADANRTPERVDALIAVLRELRRPEEALNLLLQGQGLGVDPEGGSPRKKRPFRSLMREIIGLALECNRPDEVEGTYRTLIRREPVRPEWRTGLALLYLLRGERDQAARVFEEGLEAAGTRGKAVMRLAQAARELSLTEAARRAAARALELDRDTRLAAHLFLVEMDVQAGATDAARARLKTVEKDYHEVDEALAQVSDSYERMKQPQDSIRVLEEIDRRSAMEDVQMRLAWLYQEKRDVENALRLWKRLWKTTRLPARVRQAEDRLLDLTSNTGRLADLAIDLEEALEAGKGSARDLSLLVKLYMRANDAVSAVEVLKMYGGKMGQGEVETLQAMAHVFQHCMDYRRYEATLTTLQRLDPENRVDYQQQIAIGALERGRGRHARRALARLKALAPGDVQSEEFAAGVLAMVGLQKESVRAYTRVVAGHPDRIEDYLLLANVMRDDGQRDRALRMFLDLLEQSDRDDMFTVAVDGLLNLNADRAMLRVAQRRVKERIARRPHKAFLYQLAADLGEELRNVDEQVGMTRLMVIVGGERRSAVLRELMDLESSRRRYAALIDYGRSLLALGEEMPPQVFLDLGRALIRVGDLTTAERVFARTRIAGDFASVQQQVASFYEEAGHLKDAARILRQALLARPDDVDLLVQVGVLAEASGDLAQARRDFTHALEVVLRRSPSATGAPRKKKTGDQARSPGGAAASARSRMVFRSYSYNRNVDDFQRYGESVMGGILGATPPPAAAFLADLETRIQAEAKELDQDDAWRDLLKNNPRMERLLTLARRAGLLYQQMDLADRMDRLVLKHYPKDENAKKNAVRERINRGYERRAGELASILKLDLDRNFRELALARMLRDPAVMKKVLEAELVTPPRAVSVLPRLLAAGRLAEARKILAAVKPDAGDADAGASRVFCLVALALDDRAAFDVWRRRWLDRALRHDDPRSGLHAYFEIVWGRLPAGERDALWKQIQERATAAEGRRQAALQEFLHVMGPRVGKPQDPPSLEVFERLLEGQRSFYRMRPVLESAPPNYVGRLFLKALEKLPKSRGRRNQILSLVTTFATEFDRDTASALVQAFRDSDADRNTGVISYLYHVSQLVNITRNASTARKLVRVLREDHPDQPVFDLAEAVLAFRSNERETGSRKLEAALRAMLERGRFERYEQIVLNRIIDGPDTPARKVLERVVEGAGKTDSILKVQIQERLLQRHGRTREAEALLARARKAHPDASALRLSHLTVLNRLGRAVEAAREQAAWLRTQSADNTYAYRALAEAYRKLGRPLDALDALGKIQSARIEPLEVYLLDRLGRDREAQQAFRKLTAQSRDRRHSYQFFSARWPAPLGKGGLDADGSGADGVLSHVMIFGASGPEQVKQSLFWHLAERPWALEDLARARRASTRAMDNEALTASLARAQFLARGRKGVIQDLEAALGRGELSDLEFAMLLLVVDQGRKPLPPSLRPALDLLRWYVLVKGRHDVGLRIRLARLYLSEKKPEAARALYRYALTEQFGRLTWFGSHLQAHALIDAYLETFPEAERSARRQELLREAEGGLVAGTRQNLERLVFYLDEWEKAGDPAALARHASFVEQTLATLPEHNRSHPLTIRLRGRLALQYAGQKRWDAFRQVVDDLLSLGQGPKVLIDTLPGTMAPGAAGELAAVLDAGLARVLEGPALARVRLHLAAWLVRVGDVDPAGEIVAKCMPYPGQLANDFLVLADVLRATGDADSAYRIEKDLLSRQALNVRRAPDVLAAMEKREGQAAADAAALKLADITDHPPVLERAAQAARRAGKDDQARELLDRLRAVAPDRAAGVK